jgi:ATP-dependent exoDNAse (exonuclease V) alpha subunit
MRRVDRVLKLLNERNLFITGGAGVGKSHLLKEIVDYYKALGLEVAALGSTGISAVNIGGQTIHSFFVFGISSELEELTQNDRYNKKRLNDLYKILKKLKLIVIDEISMVSSDLMDMILYRLRSSGFKGRVVVSGDFYQLPPINKNKKESIFKDDIYAFESSSWEFFDFLTVKLQEVKRSNDKEFISVLNDIRVGRIDGKVLEYLQSLRANEVDPSSATMLYGTNREVDRINANRLRELSTKEINLQAKLDIKEDIDDRRLSSWKNSLPISENLLLKEGASVLFTTNRWGFYHNGERGVVEHIDDDMVVVEKDRRLIKVERFEFDLTKTVIDHKGEIESIKVATLSQFPLRLSYAVTIHKSQGMSIDNLICNVETIFAESQFYVALSRATNPSNLSIKYGRGDFESYVKRVVRVSPKVERFYDSLDETEVVD